MVSTCTLSVGSSPVMFWPGSSSMTTDKTDLIGMVVTALITLIVLGVMAYGAMSGKAVGAFEQYGAIVIGYWFGAKAQSAVARAASDGLRVPSVL